MAQTIGKYDIIREIARSNDVVYEGWDPVLNRRIAIKELNQPPGGSDPNRLDRFKREARALATLSHPNIMAVYELGVSSGRYFIVMEYLDGTDLRKELERVSTFTPDKALAILGSVLEGLAFAHKNGVVHRDIKPENIQILSNGTVKITDFGIAKLTFEPSLTRVGEVFGTPSYLSPEQACGKTIDGRSDIFSTAVILYEMLSGRKPFLGNSVVEITSAVIHQPAPEIANISTQLMQVIHKGLEKEPQNRYATAAEFKSALQDALHARQVTPPSSAYSSASYSGGGVAVAVPPIVQNTVSSMGSASFIPPLQGGVSSPNPQVSPPLGFNQSVYSGNSKGNFPTNPSSVFPKILWFIAFCLICLLGVTVWRINSLEPSYGSNPPGYNSGFVPNSNPSQAENGPPNDNQSQNPLPQNDQNPSSSAQITPGNPGTNSSGQITNPATAGGVAENPGENIFNGSQVPPNSSTVPGMTSVDPNPGTGASAVPSSGTKGPSQASASSGTSVADQKSTPKNPSPNTGELFPQTRERLLTEAEASKLSKSQIQYALNEMYARHGKVFADQGLVQTFGAFTWYQPDPAKTDAVIKGEMSPIELANERLLQLLRK